MAEVRIDQLEEASTKILADEQSIHISGEPGIGKSEFLRNIITQLESYYHIETHTVQRQHTSEILEQDLLHIVRRAAPERDSKPNQTVSGGGSGLGFGANWERDDRARDLLKLQDLTRGWSGYPLLVCVENIERISDDDKEVRGIIADIAAHLSEPVQLITVGRVSELSECGVEEIQLKLYTIEETRRFLESEYEEVTDDTVSEVHNAAEGHPSYIRLLIDSSTDITDFQLPDNEVLDTIESRYIDALPADTEEFLREVAPLPELEEKVCSSVLEDFSPTEVEHLLKRLNRRDIVQSENRTDEGDRIYTIHYHFRMFLLQKHGDATDVHRKAIQHNLNELVRVITSDMDDRWTLSMPYSFRIRYHLQQLGNGEVTPEAFREEVDRADIAYPVRGVVMVYAGMGIMPSEAVPLFRQEHELFGDWILESVDNQPQAQFVVKITEWLLSQLADDDPMHLSEVEVEGSMDDLPAEAQPFADLEMSEEFAKKVHQSRLHLLQYFLNQEPYCKKTHREHTRSQMDLVGISFEVLKELKSAIDAVIRDSGVDSGLEAVMDEYKEGMGQQLSNTLSSNVDFYLLRNQMMDVGKEVFNSVHHDLILHTGLLADVAIEGGKELEKADNPGFALIWYSFFTMCLRNYDEESDDFERVRERFESTLEKRKQYEKGIEDPLFTAEDDVPAIDKQQASGD